MNQKYEKVGLVVVGEGDSHCSEQCPWIRGLFGKEDSDGEMFVACPLFGLLVYDKDASRYMRSQECIDCVIAKF